MFLHLYFTTYWWRYVISHFDRLSIKIWTNDMRLFVWDWWCICVRLMMHLYFTTYWWRYVISHFDRLSIKIWTNDMRLFVWDWWCFCTWYLYTSRGFAVGNKSARCGRHGSTGLRCWWHASAQCGVHSSWGCLYGGWLALSWQCTRHRFTHGCLQWSRHPQHLWVACAIVFVHVYSFNLIFVRLLSNLSFSDEATAMVCRNLHQNFVLA